MPVLVIGLCFIIFSLFQIQGDLEGLKKSVSKLYKPDNDVWQYTTFMWLPSARGHAVILLMPDERLLARSIGQLLLKMGSIPESEFVKVGEKNFIRTDLFNSLGMSGWQLIQCQESPDICTFKRLIDQRSQAASYLKPKGDYLPKQFKGLDGKTYTFIPAVPDSAQVFSHHKPSAPVQPQGQSGDIWSGLQ